MKRISILVGLILIYFNSFAQFPVNPNVGVNNINQNWVGAYTFQRGMVAGTYADTTAANLIPYMKGVPFIMISTTTDNAIWFRNSAATKWIQLLPSGSPTGLSAWTTTLNTNIPTDLSLNGYFGTTGANGIGFYTGNTQRLILPAGGLTFNQLVSDTTANKVMTFNPSTKAWGYGYWYGGSGATPTWQQTLTAGSTLTGTNSVDASGGIFEIVGANYINFAAELVRASNIVIYEDSINIFPGLGNLRIDTLTNNVGTKALRYNPTTGLVSYADTTAGGGGWGTTGTVATLTGASELDQATYDFAHMNGSVGIGISTPDASALLDVSSTTKGLLIPRMTEAEKNAIGTPATGLMIFQTDGTSGFYYYNGTAWASTTNFIKSIDTTLAGGNIVLDMQGNDFEFGTTNASAGIKTVSNLNTIIGDYVGVQNGAIVKVRAGDDIIELRNTPDNVKVGINTTTPDSTLTVTGSAHITQYLNIGTLTSGRIPYVTTDGRLTDDANFSYVTATLTINGAFTNTDNTSTFDYNSGGSTRFKVSGSGSDDKIYMLSPAISAGSNGDAITLVDNTTGELGVAPNLAFNLRKDSTDMYTVNGTIWVKDKNGNKTQISPHDDKGDWIYKSTDKNGVTTEINMIKLAELLERVSGEKLIYKTKSQK